MFRFSPGGLLAIRLYLYTFLQSEYDIEVKCSLQPEYAIEVNADCSLSVLYKLMKTAKYENAIEVKCSLQSEYAIEVNADCSLSML